jgi:hypothetical protein
MPPKKLKTDESKNEMSSRIPDKPFVLEMPPVETGGCSILMIGSGRSGKTTALKYILDRDFKKHLGVIFSQSAKATAYKHMKYPLLPLSVCYLPDLMNDAFLINKDTNNHYPFLFVLDDQPLVKNDKQLLKLTTIYRNSGISGIVCMQSPTLVNPTCRSNFTYTLLFKLNSTEQIDTTIKMFLRGVFPQSWNYDRKIAEYKRLTDDHHFIFIDNWNGGIYRCKLDLCE